MTDYTNTLHILYGSRTGNAKAVADLANRYAQSLGYNTKFIDMPSFDTTELSKVKNLLITVSTHGEGEPPVQAEGFYDFLHKQAGKVACNFTVLGLGDSSYRYYCQTSKDIDKKLEELGGKRLLDVGACDIDFEEEAKIWVKAAVDAFHKKLSPLNKPIDKFVFELDLEDGSKNAYKAELLEKRMLTTEDSSKKVMHLSLSLKNSSLTYLPGDALGVFSSNSRLFVDKLLTELGFDKAFAVKQKDTTRLLKEMLLNDYELTLLTPLVIQKYQALVKNPKLAELIANPEALQSYAESKDMLDLVSDYKGSISELEFLSILRPLAHRLYSVASSSKENAEVVDITVKIIENESKGRIRNGVCSSYFWHRLEVGDKVPVTVETIDKFRLPEQEYKPIIMIGAGTGIAPYRGFLQERKMQKGKNWLFFGERNHASDFLYGEELKAYEKEGTLSKLSTAFSRDQKDKYYVSDLMLEQADELYQWIEEGAIVYVCGSKDKLAKSVRESLLKIFEQNGHTNGAALKKLEALKASKHFQEEVY